MVNSNCRSRPLDENAVLRLGPILGGRHSRIEIGNLLAGLLQRPGNAIRLERFVRPPTRGRTQTESWARPAQSQVAAADNPWRAWKRLAGTQPKKLLFDVNNDFFRKGVKVLNYDLTKDTLSN
jgi:hypothetical protein